MTILQDMRVAIGQDSNCSDYDQDLIFYTNLELADKVRLGIGTKDFVITGDSETWDDYEPSLTHMHSLISGLIGLKVKLLFDGESLSGAVTETLKQQISMLENRIADDSDGCI